MQARLVTLLAAVALLAATTSVALASVVEKTAPTAGVSLLDRLPPAATHAAEVAATAKSAGTTMGVVDVFSRLNVRSGPGLDYSILGMLNPGTAVHIIGKRGDWFKITWHRREAWICGYYVWTPGKGVWNQSIRSTVARLYPDLEPGRRRVVPEYSPASGSPTSGSRSSGTASRSSDPGRTNVPSGPQVGQRRADGGLAVPLFNQNRIGARYPGGFCGPTSLKMTLAYYGITKDINYLGLQDVGGATPVYSRGVGAGHQAMLDMLRHCGLKGSKMYHGKSIAWLKQQTDAGKPVVVSVCGNYGPRSTNGHILVVVGVTKSGDVIINDSAGGQRHVCPARQFYGAWSGRSHMAIVAQR